MKKSGIVLIASLLIAPVRSFADPDPIAAPAQDITLNFQNTDIDMVLQFFSQVTGKIFVKSDLVRGFVTVAAPGKVALPEAMDILQSVLEVKGFTLVPGNGKMIKVLPQTEAAQQGGLEVAYGADVASSESDRMITQVIPLKFVSPTDFKASLTPLMSKSGSLIADERTNAIVVTDMASNVRRLIKMADALDVRAPQVLIEALIMEITLTDETKLGVEWSNTGNFTSHDHTFNTQTSQGFSLSDFISEGLKYSLIRDDGKLSGVIQALATNKDVNILSTPHIMTLNNQPAVIRVGEEVPILTQTRNIQGGETIRSYDYKSVAIELEVTPRINVDREVLLKVHPLVKKILGFNAELNAPILANREAQTVVSIKSGQTVVIGGLMKDDRASSVSKVPLLGDIPLLGMLFRKQGNTREKTELLVFITPRVVTTPEEAQALTIKKESESKDSPTPYRKSAREHYEDGERAYDAKNYHVALDEWRQALALSPDQKLRTRCEKRIKKAEKKIK